MNLGTEPEANKGLTKTIVVFKNRRWSSLLHPEVTTDDISLREIISGLIKS